VSAEADRTGTIRMQGRAASRRADRAQPALAQLQRLEPLPSGAEALDEPFRAFPSWFLQIECECDRCGKVQMVKRRRPVAGPQLARHHRPNAPRRLRRARWQG
jgi:hypothetical protein